MKPCHDRSCIHKNLYFNLHYYIIVELTLENDKEAFSMARVRDEAVTMVRTLIRLAETMKPIPEVSTS